MTDNVPLLESWKEIAVYLKKDITTVRRWEKAEGLPVYRHSHKSRSSVYAYPSEIDAWRAGRKVVPEPAPVRSFWRWPAFAATMLLCLIMVGNGVRPVSAQQPVGIQARMVWQGRKLSAGGPSPDGRYIAWADWLTRGGDLAIHDLTTGQDRDLTNGPPNSYAEAPVFSPDGKQILYGWYNAPVDKWELRLIGVDGSNQRVFGLDAYAGAFAPDGKKAALVVEQNGAQELALIDLASGKVTPLKTLDWRKPEIGNFSPDGRYLVYSALTSQDSLDRGVYAMAVDGSSESELVSAHGMNQGAFYAPDGSRVVFTSDRSGRWDLWGVPIAGDKAAGSPELLKTDIGSVKNLGFTRDGTLFFSQAIDQRDAYTAEIDPATWTIKGSPQRVSDRYIGNSAAPRWSPDGRSLAYIVYQGLTDEHGSAQVTFVIRSGEPAAERQFQAPFRTAQLADYFRWFPDNNSLLLVEWGPKHDRTFRRLVLATGEVRPLFHAPFGRPEFTSISSDGEKILYALQNKTLVEHNLATGRETTLRKDTLTISPDGSQAATLRTITEGDQVKGWSVWIATLPAGDSRELWAPKDKYVQPRDVVWDPQGKGLFMITSEDNDYWGRKKGFGIWYVPLDGSRPHSIGVNMAAIESISVGPGNHIGFTGGPGSSEQVWSVRGLLTATRDGGKSIQASAGK